MLTFLPSLASGADDWASRAIASKQITNVKKEDQIFKFNADLCLVSNIGNGIPDWQFFHPQSGDFVQFLAKKLDLFVI